MLKSIVEKLAVWGEWLSYKPLYWLPLTVWPLALVYIALILIWLWLLITKPLWRRNDKSGC